MTIQEPAGRFGDFNVHPQVRNILSMDTSNSMKTKSCWEYPKVCSQAEVHGRILELHDGGTFQAYLRKISILRFSEYLHTNELVNLLGLHVLAEEAPGMICKSILKDNGTMVLGAKDVKSWVPCRVSGSALGGAWSRRVPGK